MQQVRQEGKASDADRPSYFFNPDCKTKHRPFNFQIHYGIVCQFVFYFSKFCFGAFEVETPVAKTPVATPVRSAAPEDLKNLRPPSSLVSGPGQPSSQPLVEAQPRVSATGVETLTENQVPKPVGVTERKAQSSKPCICFADIIIGT